MRKWIITAALALGVIGKAEAVNPIYGTVQITTSPTISPALQLGAIKIGSATVAGPMTATGTVTLGSAGFATTISSNAVLNGAIVANGTPGVAGQYLKSQGPGLTPIFSGFVASDIVGSSPTWTSSNTYTYTAKFSSNVVDGSNTQGTVGQSFQSNAGNAPTWVNVPSAILSTTSTYTAQQLFKTVTTSSIVYQSDGSTQTVAYSSNTVTFAITVATSTSLTNFVPTTLTLQITPKVATHRIMLLFSGSMFVSNASNNGTVGFARNAAVIGNGCARAVNGAAAESDFPISCVGIDAPGTTSAVTYTVYMKSGTAGQSIGLVSNTENNTLIAQEIP